MNGIGADAVLECVGTQDSMSRLPPTESNSTARGLFFTHVRLHGGPAPVDRFLPELIDLVWNGKINPGKVFDLTSASRLPGSSRAGAQALCWLHGASIAYSHWQTSRLAGTARHSPYRRTTHYDP